MKTSSAEKLGVALGSLFVTLLGLTLIVCWVSLATAMGVLIGTVTEYFVGSYLNPVLFEISPILVSLGLPKLMGFIAFIKAVFNPKPAQEAYTKITGNAD